MTIVEVTNVEKRDRTLVSSPTLARIGEAEKDPLRDASQWLSWPCGGWVAFCHGDKIPDYGRGVKYK